MRLTLTHKTTVAPALLRIRLTSPSTLPTFRAGQYVVFNLRDQRGAFRRSYSIASPPGALHWDFYISLVDGGRGSTVLQHLSIGHPLKAKPPMGIFTLQPPPGDRLVLIATSTGVVPYRSMSPQLQRYLEAGHPVSLLQGVRRADRLLFRDHWYQLLSSHDNFEYIPCLSRPQSPQECQRHGAIKGRVQTALQRLPLLSQNNHYYLCGNPQMIEETEQLLTQAGIDLDQIIVEAFESPDA